MHRFNFFFNLNQIRIIFINIDKLFNFTKLSQHFPQSIKRSSGKFDRGLIQLAQQQHKFAGQMFNSWKSMNHAHFFQVLNIGNNLIYICGLNLWLILYTGNLVFDNLNTMICFRLKIFIKNTLNSCTFFNFFLWRLFATLLFSEFAILYYCREGLFIISFDLFTQIPHKSQGRCTLLFFREKCINLSWKLRNRIAIFVTIFRFYWFIKYSEGKKKFFIFGCFFRIFFVLHFIKEQLCKFLFIIIEKWNIITVINRLNRHIFLRYCLFCSQRMLCGRFINHLWFCGCYFSLFWFGFWKCIGYGFNNFLLRNFFFDFSRNFFFSFIKLRSLLYMT